MMATRSKSSKSWLNEHVNDPYVHQAQKDGYRARAAYKLLEINDKDKLIKNGTVLADLGSAPGSWSQVAVKLAGSQGRVFAQVQVRKPKASRSRSSEVYLLGRNKR